MIPYMEKEVALEIIKQFPVYVEFVELAVDTCYTVMQNNFRNK